MGVVCIPQVGVFYTILGNGHDLHNPSSGCGLEYLWCDLHPSRGCDLHPSRGCDLHPSRGCDLHPSRGCDLHPSRGCDLHPSRGCDLHPSRGCDLHPSSGCDLHPSSGCDLHPSSGCDLHPSRGCGLHPSSGCDLHPSRGCGLHPSRGCICNVAVADLGGIVSVLDFSNNSTQITPNPRHTTPSTSNLQCIHYSLTKTLLFHTRGAARSLGTPCS